jgi:hypothetical protein
LELEGKVAEAAEEIIRDELTLGRVMASAIQSCLRVRERFLLLELYRHNLKRRKRNSKKIIIKGKKY